MNIWLDDVRQMPEGFDTWCKAGEECIHFIQQGSVDLISFDS